VEGVEGEGGGGVDQVRKAGRVCGGAKAEEALRVGVTRAGDLRQEEVDGGTLAEGVGILAGGAQTRVTEGGVHRNPSLATHKAEWPTPQPRQRLVHRSHGAPPGGCVPVCNLQRHHALAVGTSHKLTATTVAKATGVQLRRQAGRGPSAGRA